MINKIIRRLFYGNKADSKAYIEYLRGLGMKIGEENHDICSNQRLKLILHAHG